MEAGDTATVVTRQTLGYPLRTLRNKLSREFAELEKAGVPPDALELFGSRSHVPRTDRGGPG